VHEGYSIYLAFHLHLRERNEPSQDGCFREATSGRAASLIEAPQWPPRGVGPRKRCHAAPAIESQDQNPSSRSSCSLPHLPLERPITIKIILGPSLKFSQCELPIVEVVNHLSDYEVARSDPRSLASPYAKTLQRYETHDNPNKINAGGRPCMMPCGIRS
jgi:hypothetical protein